jgi:Protein of unknown function (DUF1643)
MQLPTVMGPLGHQRLTCRCVRLSRAWGYGGIVVVNLYALRATDPEHLRRHPDPVGDYNDDHIDAAARDADGLAPRHHTDPANDGLLGSGTYRQGIRATELRPGEDRGTAVTTGLTANRFELVNGFYIPFDEDHDQVTPVITRAMALLAEHGRPVPTTDTQDADQEPPVDHLSGIQPEAHPGAASRRFLPWWRD